MGKDSAPVHELPILGGLNDSQDCLSTCTTIDDDGRVSINIRERKPKLSKLFRPFSKKPSLVDSLYERLLVDEALDSDSVTAHLPPPPPLNIVIQIVGSRGDVQPFIALGLELKSNFGHRVRIATHSMFKVFVEEHGLEFFDIGGNPEELMAFMFRNPGLLPNYEAFRSGDVKRQRKNMYEILKGCWRACIEPGNGMDKDQKHSRLNMSDSQPRHFIADAIIANPPSFAHIHCAERLGIPLHLMFTMPYSPTEAFPHPLASIRSSDLPIGITNRFSYALIERLTWHGLGDLINKFREEKLGLAPLNLMWAAGLITRLKIPYTYCWSPALLPKPKDWGPHVSVPGFFVLPSTDAFIPPPDLVEFLEAEDPPIYIGFGSIIIDDSEAMTSMIFEAIKQAGVRAVVSKGWGGLGTTDIDLPPNVFLIGSIPHTWIFERVSVVVHHGGAGTTAAGLLSGKPTVIVPFFGDQPFWGEMVARAGAGPHPIAYRKQTADSLAQQIQEALHPETMIRARQIGLKLQRERGCENGVRSFHRHLYSKHLRCSIFPDRVAVWEVKHRKITVGTLAAAILVQRELVSIKDVIILRQREYHIEDRPVDPITGGAIAFLGSFGDVTYETFNLPVQLAKGIIESTKGRKGVNDSSSRVEFEEKPGRDALSHATVTTPSQTSNQEREEREELRDPELWKDQLAQSLDVIVTAGKGIGRATKAYLASPLHFSLALARGFQNIPVAYGDTMVRKPEKVQGAISGMRIGARELAFGFYDGITGVVTQPINGAKENGVIGAVTSIGKGVGGLILKPGAGLFGLPAYSLQGISIGLHKLFAPDYDEHIKLSRLAQGREEMATCGEDQQEQVVRAWKQLCSLDTVNNGA